MIWKARRLVILIALSLAILALFAVHAYAIIDGGSGLSADQLIDFSNGIYIPNNGIPENPAAARKLWSEESGINFTMPGNLSENGTNPQASRSSVKTGEALEYQTASTVSSGQAKAASSAEPAISQAPLPTSSPAISQTTSPTVSKAGNWSFRLKDSKNRFLALTLFQSENAVFGTGNINDGGDTMKASASGSVSADKLSLDVISSGTVNLYRLRLNLSGNSASGEYRAFSTKGDPWTGIVEGVLAAK
ncbi:MAG: hypothetical protein NTX42_00200 [Methanothrix sp.]|nr:hypothetical protein [Methanothrix sp.]